MMFSFVKKIYRKISNEINNTFVFFIWLVFFFLTGSLSVLFIPNIMNIFGIYAFPMGGVTFVVTFIVCRRLLQVLGNGIRLLIFLK